jgi:hypothetical protein
MLQNKFILRLWAPGLRLQVIASSDVKFSRVIVGENILEGIPENIF